MALPTDIAKISAMQDPVVRNLLITQRYHDLSECLHDTLGGPNVNWSTFATWASKTAGESIRNEEVPPFVRDLVDDAEDDVMHRFGRLESVVDAIVPTTGFHASFLLAPVRETIGTVSQSIAAGNLKVFAELAPQFVRFVQAMGGGATPQALAALLEPLDPRPTAEGGQDQLRLAFTSYYEAILEPDPTHKARL
ncbi:MAG TPA: hypothetical protein VIF09_11040, partial [Polyangiaceae bacterium]